MKVILLRDVARLGRKGEVKEVPSGHAINFLIPRKLAAPATPEHMKRHAEETKKASERKQQGIDLFKTSIAILASKSITYAADSNEKGSLFRGINAEDIATCLNHEGVAITKSQVVLEHPIKEIGPHQITLEHGGVQGSFTLMVVKK